MLQQDIHDYLYRYFSANQCQIVENGPGHLTVQLTIDMDKELMNRPFYWHYLEKTGGIANPMSLTLITQTDLAPPDLKGEPIHFGSPRLHQIFHSSQKLASHIRLYEQLVVPEGNQVPLYPWICINICISYRCDRKKDMLHSLGLNLINGIIIEDFIEKATTLTLTPKIPDFSFTLSPLIKIPKGMDRLKHYISNRISQDDHQWAVEARKRWKIDLDLLQHFFQDHSDEGYLSEKEALRFQYEPRIDVKIINGGLFYLGTTFNK